MDSNFYTTRINQIKNESYISAITEASLFDTIDENPEESNSQDTGYKIIKSNTKVPYPLLDTADGFVTSGSYYTSSVQNNTEYFRNVYVENPQTTTSAKVQYSVAYGNMVGSGSVNKTLNPTTKAVYQQMKNLMPYRDLAQNNAPTAFNTVFESNASRQGAGGMFVSFSKNVIRDGLDWKYFQLKIKGKTFTAVSASVDSADPEFVPDFYYLSSSTSPHAGIIIPRMGIAAVSLTEVPTLESALTENVVGGFTESIYDSIDYIGGRTFQYSDSRVYFLRIKYNKFNFTTNDTNHVLGSTITKARIVEDGEVWFTTIGLFDSDNNLLATAKLSNALRKNSGIEYVFNVNLNY